MKKVKFINNNIIQEGLLIDDKHFVGGKKIEFTNEEGTKCVYAIDLVTILNDEHSGSTRN
jgi:hypothetical protein